jgi:hypothetical protein
MCADHEVPHADHEVPHAGPDPGARVERPSGPAAAQPHAARKSSRFQGLGASYWKLWGASSVSNLGDGVSMIAFPWLATVLTDDAFLVALMGVATRLPWLLFSLPAGAIADRLDRRRIMISMNAMRGGVVGSVAVLVHLDLMSLPLLYLAALLLGLAEVLFDNTSQVILPAVVRKDQLVKLLGNGDLDKKIEIEVHAYSKSAREKVEAAGGAILEIN